MPFISLLLLLLMCGESCISLSLTRGSADDLSLKSDGLPCLCDRSRGRILESGEGGSGGGCEGDPQDLLGDDGGGHGSNV